MDIRQLFALNLRRIRQEQGFSQENLAHDADIDRAHISKLERSKAYAGLEVIEKLAVALQEPPDSFLRPLTKRAARKEPLK
ncbi:helix-turn-helix domain-containing protein [Afipia birgiae]|jgi:transcriptional regulator with XRE-family HTH domain|uniref:helix-turn-helix domain-containing protein n=1 Tax=Afipia birgiae TaxID=151414 RepID=UPI000590E06F|nr:helix-turn-helix transcriptional regulator [Afipia birgiae]